MASCQAPVRGVPVNVSDPWRGDAGEPPPGGYDPRDVDDSGDAEWEAVADFYSQPVDSLPREERPK